MAAVAGEAGGMLGQGLSSLAGALPPEQARQAKIDEMMQKFPKPTTYEDYMTIAGEFMTSGMPDMGEKFNKLAQDMKGTTDSRGALQKSVEYMSELNQCSALELGSEEYQACMQKSLQDAEDYKRLTAGETFERRYATKAADDILERDSALITSAESAVNAIIKTNEVLDLLDDGELHTGVFADFKTNISRILSMAGDDISGGYAERTQLLEALLGSDVFPMIKSLGIGARGLDTPEERKFLLKVMTGEKTMEASTIRRMTEIRQRLSKVIINKYNAKVNKGGFNRYSNISGEAVEEINLKGLEKSKVPKSAIPTVGPDGKSYMFDPETGQMYLNGRKVNIPK